MTIDIDTYRHPKYPVERLLLERWSPRAMSGETLSDNELNTLFEAARWAPSCFNEQPWNFLYTHSGTEDWVWWLMAWPGLTMPEPEMI